MSRRVIIIGSVLTCFFISLTGVAQKEELLDLTKEKPRVKTNKTFSGSAGSVSVGDGQWRRSTLPLKLTLISLDKQQYELSERFVYDVRLENFGDQTIMLPWEPERENILPTPNSSRSDLLQASLYLIFDELQSDAVFGSEAVYGSPSAPQSVKKLLPGESIRIRASGGWYLGSEDLSKRVLPTLPRRFTARIKFILRGTSKEYEAVISNSLQVELRKRSRT